MIYRPSYSEKHRVTTATFFDEFQTYLSQAVHAQTTHSLMIAGDFNIRMDTDTDADKIRMCDVLSRYDLTHVDMYANACIRPHTRFNYHYPGRHNSELLFSCPKADCVVSSHMFVLYMVNLPRPPLETQSVSCRKQIDNSDFSNDLNDITNALLNVTDINQLVGDYNTELRQLLDRIGTSL